MPRRPLAQITALFVGATLAIAAAPAQAVDLTWNFDGATPLAASIGSATIQYYDPLSTNWGPGATQFGTAASLGLPAFPSGGSGGVMRFPATTPTQGYQVFPGGSGATAYTMFWDFLSPAAYDGKWRGLLQTNLANDDDGDLFIQNSASGGIGINGSYQGSIAPNTWNRIAITRSATGTLTKFINGALVGTQPADDERFDLASSFYLFADENNETAAGYVSSFRYVDSALTNEQVRLLGNVSAAGATVAGPTIPAPPPEPPAPTPPLFGRTQIMGHRGGGTLAPENTMAAFAKGYEVGNDLFELDVHLTADGHAVVFHDDTLDRTTNGSGPIANLTLAQVKALDAGSWYGPQYAGEKVPTLTEVLQYTVGKGRTILDVKVAANQAFRDAVDDAIFASRATSDDIWIWPSSGQYTSDPRFGNAEIQLLTSIPSNLSDANLLALKASGIDGLSIGDGSITQEAINAFHKNGMWVDVYTVNSPARMEQLIAMGVDSIETDRPDLMADIIYAGDANGDFDVDGADFLAWQRGGSGITLADWKKTYGHARGIPANASPAATTASTSIPEPAGVLILLIAAGVLLPLAPGSARGSRATR
ncbi:glycerophosphodiester phosphodiesterase family protein [Lacipirellula sp.]|uniref:glycerophosphodiester phosphodiesterase family protein n=1 Tax=Lacipirellula sp. TaxID=2691419 RepID=UPI003D12EF6C